MNLLNTTGQTGATVTLSKQECPSLATAWLVDGNGSFQPLSATDTGQGWKFSVPTDMQSTALLIERCEPLVDVEAPAYAARGETVPVAIRVGNLNPESVSGTVKIIGPRGFKAKPVRLKPLATGLAQEVTLQLRVPNAKTPRRFDLDAVVETPLGRARRLFWIYVGEPVRLTVRESTTASRGVDVLLENMSGRPVNGTCEVPASDFVEAARAGFELAAHAQRVVVIPLSVKKSFDLPTPVQLKVRYGNVTREFVQSLTPNVINGDFEVDLADDRQPDGWSFYGPGGLHGMLRYDQAGLDDQIKHTGRYSLRLPPAPTGKSNIGLAMRVHMLVGHKYKIRVAIRREVAGPAYVVAGGPVLGRDGKVGEWEVFETVVTPEPSKIAGPGAQTDCLGTLPIQVVNATPGMVWFDSITVEPVE